MQVYLEIVNGPLSGQKRVLRSLSELTVGRTAKAGFVVPDDRLLSSLHLRFVCDQNSCRVQDLGSTNGTQVNSSPVTDFLLSDGDRITAGETIFAIRIEGVAATQLPQSESDQSSTIIPAYSDAPSQANSGDYKPFSLFPSDEPGELELPSIIPDSIDPSRADLAKDSNPDSHRSIDPESIRAKMNSDKTAEAYLKIMSGSYAGRMIGIHSGKSVVFGSADSANQSIDDDGLLSLTHFQVEIKPTGFQIRDLNSLRGTFVNGLRITNAPLFDGDQVLAGTTEFLVCVAAKPVSGIDVTWPPFAAALEDEDPVVARESLLAATWTRQHWLMEFCRRKAVAPNPKEIAILHLLAILGMPSDLEAMQKIGSARRLGPLRFQVLGSFGHPDIIREILPSIDDPDPATAVAAGRAFKRITGIDIDSDVRVEFELDSRGTSLILEQATSVSAFVPDSDRARASWDSVKGTYYQGSRWCCGLDLSNGVTGENYLRLDTLAFWEARLRDKFNGSSPDGLAAFEKFHMSKWKSTVSS